MFLKKLYYIFISKNPNRAWLKVLLFVALLVFLVFFYKWAYSFWGLGKTEGFTLTPVISEKYLLKRNQDIYDEFYVDMYEAVRSPPEKVEQQVNTIIQMTQPSKSASVFLDIGTGKGATLETLKSKGYVNVYGIDKSPVMVKKCFLPKQVVQGDALETMNFEKNTFTHVMCLGGTVYDVEPSEIILLFQNARYWLKHGGYFIVELTDFSATQSMAAKTINTPEFTYKHALEFKTDSQRITVLETFTDKNTHNVRENEVVLEKTAIGDILNDAMYCGFSVVGKTKVAGTSPPEYVYVFQ